MEITISQNVLDHAKRFAGKDEALVTFLKRSGLSKSLSVLAFAEVAGVPRAVAKLIVHRSQAWNVQRANDDAIHSALLNS